MEELLAVFAALSRSNGKEESDGLITHVKLEAACREFEVRYIHKAQLHFAVVQQN